MTSIRAWVLAASLLSLGMPLPAISQTSTPLKSATWWNPAASGWGLFTIDQGNVLAPGWRAYDENGVEGCRSFPGQQ